MMRIFRAFILTASLALVSALSGASGQAMQSDAPKSSSANSAAVPAEANVIGTSFLTLEKPSWLKQKGLTVSKTKMGQMGGSSPAASGPAEILNPIMQRFLSSVRSDSQQASAALNEPFPATGADLYRWNCEACHGVDGKGSDPEINSVIGPVQGTSETLTRARMEARGIEADDDMVKQMCELATESLQDRLQHGGKIMPAFDNLRADEVEALLGYLEKLSSVPVTKRDGLLVPESAARIGQHILKGTCSICHDGRGPGSGEIPSMASMPRNRSLSTVVHQVQYGSSAKLKKTGSQVMPAYPYFTEDEIAAAYFALSAAESKSQPQSGH